MAGRRAFTEIFHNGIGSIFGFRFQLETGRVAVINGYGAGIDAFTLQTFKNVAAMRVVANAANPAHAETEPGQACRHVQFRPRDALNKVLDVFQRTGFGGHEHGHGLADSDDIQRVRHRLNLA